MAFSPNQPEEDFIRITLEQAHDGTMGVKASLGDRVSWAPLDALFEDFVTEAREQILGQIQTVRCLRHHPSGTDGTTREVPRSPQA